MCRVNPKKIRQPKNYPDLWILNPTPKEIRPYRILIKRIPISPLVEGFLTVSPKPIDNILDLFKSKDFSFYQYRSEYKYIIDKLGEENKINNLKDDKFILTFYSYDFYISINNYLREGNNSKYQNLLNDERVKSAICCLQESLKINKNVKEGTIVYRGLSFLKFSDEINVGSKFYFKEFISTSINKEQAEKFCSKDGTILTIIIRNNKKRNYCYNITNYSLCKNEEEILISSFCLFSVRKIKRVDKGVDEVELDCEGFILDDLLKK